MHLLNYMAKIISLYKLCIACQANEIAPWSDYYFAKCDEYLIDRPEDELLIVSYWEKRRKGLI
jgi:hypothetical protein